MVKSNSTGTRRAHLTLPLALCLLLGWRAAAAGSFLDALKPYVVASSGAALASPGRVTQRLSEPELDWVTEKCIACHNGDSASAVALKGAGTPLHFSGHRSVGHPVGMDYADYARNLPGEYRSVAQLAPEIHFVEGKVSCISCHQSSLAKTQALQVAGNSAHLEVSCPSSLELNTGPGGSGLCMSCHIK